MASAAVHSIRIAGVFSKANRWKPDLTLTYNNSVRYTEECLTDKSNIKTEEEVRKIPSLASTRRMSTTVDRELATTTGLLPSDR